MPALFGETYSKDELRMLTGCMEQLAGVRQFEFSDGKARQLRAADVWTGSGFRFTVYLDRGMDIGPADHYGRPLAWIHPALGVPGQFEPQGLGFLRTWGGGLLTTCGLTHFGQPEQDGAEALGLHGRISHIPAQDVHIYTGWDGDEYLLRIEGRVTQAVIFGEYLTLNRCISTKLGASWLKIEDRICNDGNRSSPHMLLYHCNFGFPVISPDSILEIDNEKVVARDEVAKAGLADHTRFELPDLSYKEQVFFHFPRPDQTGYVKASILNRKMNFGVYLRYRAQELPALAQWKMMGGRDYVCALEPCTVHETLRSTLRREKRLLMLEPGQEIQYSLEIGVLQTG